MKKYLPKRAMELVLMFLLFFISLYSQVDSSAESFFPHHIGDVWEYDNINSVYKIKLTKDTIIQSTSFLYYNGGDVPYYKIDSLLNVVQYPTISKWTNLLINLKAEVGGWWISEDTTSDNPEIRIVGRVDDISWGFVFGVETQIKRVGYYFQPVNDTTDFHSWRNDAHFAAGIGYLLSQYDIGPPDEQLLGCIINGVQYGTISSASIKWVKEIPELFKLNPSFPNPFNPSTTIQYEIPQSSFVKIVITNQLGQQIELLVDSYKHAGSYRIIWNASKYSSGMYLCTMICNNFMRTTKLIFVK